MSSSGEDSPTSKATTVKTKPGLMKDTILPENYAETAMTFREDMFSLLFISLVKPQYKLYCEIVHRTKQQEPYDLHQPLITI